MLSVVDAVVLDAVVDAVVLSVVLDVAVLDAVVLDAVVRLSMKCCYEVARPGRSDSRWKPATATTAAPLLRSLRREEKFLAKCPCPCCSVLLPCSCADDVG